MTRLARLRPNMALQRTRRPRFRSDLSLRSLGSPLNAQPLDATRGRAWIGTVAVGLLVIACSATPDRASRLVEKIANSDIAWDGTYIGLTPRIEGEPSRNVLALGTPATAALVAALDDPERFAAAHVLLTQIRMHGAFEVSGHSWNQLRVELRTNGQVTLDPAQRHQLKAFWRGKVGV